MKTIVLITVLFCTSTLVAQTGGLVLHLTANFIDVTERDSFEVEIWKDSTFLYKGKSRNKFIVRDLPLGIVDIYASFRDTSFLHKVPVYVQNNQLIYRAFEIDERYTAMQPSSINLGRPHLSNDPSLRGRNALDRHAYNYVDGIMVRTGGTIELASCVVTCYKSHITYDQGSSYTRITREDIKRMPTRNVNEIAATTGGVAFFENNDVHIRGARSSQNVYYLDGARVNSPDGIPKSYVDQIRVYSGGAPANYGDFTGGVISVHSKELNFNRMLSYDSGYSSSSTTGYTQPAAPTLYFQEAVVKEAENYLSYDQFAEIYENDFLSPLTQPNSTFGIDVDRASWTYMKTKFELGEVITRDAVKIEEMLNSFQHKKVEIPEGEMIGVELERNACSWNPQNELVSIRLRAMDLPKDLPRKAHNIVLLVDVSGSMSSENKLPLLIEGFEDFVNGMEACDRISIVTYAGYSSIALEPTTCDQKEIIIEALYGLISGGGTNGIGGIKMAYELAEKNYDPEANNRIILATDGDFNVGINDPKELEDYIFQKRGKGIYLTALGFGMGNYRNDILETLADNGDGNHFYINNRSQSHKVLTEDIGNIINLGRDVKLNVEFNPKYVESYRLIGYENRLMPAEDFEDDAKDGGEMGYGHTVIAVYEIVPGKVSKVESHFTQTKATFNNEELAFVKLRFKELEDSTSVERRFSLGLKSDKVENPLVNLIVSLGLQLRDSAFKGNLSEEELIRQASAFSPKNEEEKELQAMILSLKED